MIPIYVRCDRPGTAVYKYDCCIRVHVFTSWHIPGTRIICTMRPCGLRSLRVYPRALRYLPQNDSCSAAAQVQLYLLVQQCQNRATERVLVLQPNIKILNGRKAGFMTGYYRSFASEPTQPRDPRWLHRSLTTANPLASTSRLYPEGTAHPTRGSLPFRCPCARS